MSRIDELEDRIITLERIVRQLQKDLIDEPEDEWPPKREWEVSKEPRYRHKFARNPETGEMEYTRVPVE